MAHQCSAAYRQIHTVIEAVNDDVAKANTVLDGVATDQAVLDLLTEAVRC